MDTTLRTLFKSPPAEAMPGIWVSGWVRTLRDSKAFAFIELADGTHFKPLQIVLEESTLSNYAEAVKTSVGASIRVRGTLVPTPEAKQPFELKAEAFELIGASDPSYPLQKKRHTFEYLRTIAHLRPRTNTYWAVMRIRSLAAFAVHTFFNDRGFIYAHTPLITGSDAEGAGEMFRVTTLDAKKPPLTASGEVDYAEDFFGRLTSLTVSGQLNGEAMCMAFRNIYTFGPTFRAENSFTPRHAAEFWMIEPEIAFADLSDNMALAQDMVKFIIAYVLDNAPDEMAFLNQFVDKGLLERLTALRDADFARVTYTDAIDILKKSGEAFQYPVDWGCDLQTEHERYLTEKHFNGPVFVTDYPAAIKSFYMRMNDGGRTVAAMDMLVPGVGELIGGSQREERLDLLKARMAELHLNEEDYWWYLQLRQWGTTPHAGYGLGFERMIMYLTGMQNIRDVIPFPRTTRSCDF